MKIGYFYSVNKKNSNSKVENELVLFFPYKNVKKSQADLSLQLRDYFHHNTLPDKLIVICFSFNKNEILEVFNYESNIYDYIPKFNSTKNDKSLSIVSIDKNGEFNNIKGKLKPIEIEKIYNHGLSKIFIKNGGLIVSQQAHHFVFPSGKHSNRFLRTGNVLISGVEISFIASALVKHYKNEHFESIYSDTSSINSLAYAYINLKKELDFDFNLSISVESFGSYQLFEKLKFEANKNSLFLISSSTSGSIIERMINSEIGSKKINLKKVAILYGLGVKKEFQNYVICDLTKNKNNFSFGVEPFITYNVLKGDKCKLCENGSKPLKVRGDVFLLEKPLVSGYTIKISDLPKYLNSFKNYYSKKSKNSNSLIRSHFKDDSYSDKKYDIYIDIVRLLKQWKNRNNNEHEYHEIFKKIKKHITQNIPASTKYIISLPDEASKLLSNIILKYLKDLGIKVSSKNILNNDSKNIATINKEDSGSIVVVSASIVTGRNLLYLSRALRDFEDNYQRIYFTLINRTGDKSISNFLSSNIGQGEFGKETHKLINIENINCSHESKNNPWHIEENELKKIIDYFDNNKERKIIQYCQIRLIELQSSAEKKGLENNLFHVSQKGKSLKLRNGFAFAPFSSGQKHSDFIIKSSQSEIYFIISSILNELRNRDVLKQTDYVRNLLHPGNFVRFNDGIIQASILRAATFEELNYGLSSEMSNQMKSVLGDMILHLTDDHSEAINEFLYAICIKKLRLKIEDLKDCIDLMDEQDFIIKNDSITKGFLEYIKKNIIILKTINEKFRS